MTLRELVADIQKNAYLFEVLLENKEFKRKSAEEVLSEYPSLEDYFIKVAHDNHVKHLNVLYWQKNGNAFIRKAYKSVAIGAIDSAIESAIDDSMGAIENEENPIENAIENSTAAIERPIEKKSMATNGTGSMAKYPNKQTFQEKNQTLSKPMDAKAEILEVRLDFAKKTIQDLEKRNRDLERKNDNLYLENNKLLRDNFTQKDKLELDYKQKKLELESERKAGLSGIVEEVKSLPPEAWQFMAGMFPNHAMNKALNGGKQAEGENESKHSDADAQLCIDTMNETLLNQSPEVVGMISMLSQAFINKPASLKQVYLKFYPQTTDNSKETNTENL